MTILVTGGAGFIGANFVSEWLALCAEPVVNLDALTYAGDLRNLRGLADDPRHLFTRGDIGDHGQVDALLRRHRPRAVVNLAAETHVDRSIDGPALFIQTNVVATHRLLETVHAYWSGLAGAEREAFRFLHVSTDEVYGDLDEHAPPFTESDRYQPNSPYSASKAAGDHLVRVWHRTYGLPILVTHCSNNYGPLQHPEKLIPLMIARAVAGEDLPVYGDGRQIRDWLFVHDHCAALRAVLAAGRVGESYNIGGLDERRNIEVVRSVCAALDALHPRADGSAHDAAIRYVTDRPGHDRRYAMDIAKIRRETGWQPREGFETGLRRTVLWYLQERCGSTEVAARTRRRGLAALGSPDATGA